jgi:signal transduction histidine kinase
MTPDGAGRAWTRRGIQTRVLLLVGVGIVAALAILGSTSWVGLNALGARLASERVLLARAVAAHLDYVVQGDLEILQGLSRAPGVVLSDVRPQPDQGVLRDAYLRSHLLERVFVVARSRAVVAEEPLGKAGIPSPAPPSRDVDAAFQSGRPVVSDLSPGAGGRLYLLVPMRDYRGQVAALAGGDIDPQGSRFATIVAAFRLGQTGAATLIDGRGRVIAGPDASRLFGPVDDWDELAPHLRAREPFVDAEARRGERAVVALYPLATAPWAVVIAQDESETFAQARSLRRTILWLAPTLLALALLFAWGAARSVRGPVVALTNSAERIAAGDLDRPIPRFADDEVGRLGHSLERMRVALRASLDTIARHNQELEDRVEARTRELQALYRELQEREAWREELLRKVISAQEDERKRLARELHDETSQTLSALAMKIETALAAWPQPTSRELLAEARALTVRTLEELHRLIFDLRPSVLDDLGLLSAIRWYAERHLEPRGIAVRCEFSGIESRLAPELETALFRVAQEAITNIAKHSRAETVLIQCFERGDQVAIEIEDDGAGFSPDTLPPPAARERGLGLLGMRERVELFGGTLEIDSAPGRGTRIAISVPLRQEVGHAQDSRPPRG